MPTTSPSRWGAVPEAEATVSAVLLGEGVTLELKQGEPTNFRTTGGGFARVYAGLGETPAL
jgi:hypothetical protein